jgi:hypothetical protein
MWCARSGPSVVCIADQPPYLFHTIHPCVHTVETVHVRHVVHDEYHLGITVIVRRDRVEAFLAGCVPVQRPFLVRVDYIISRCVTIFGI